MSLPSEQWERGKKADARFKARVFCIDCSADITREAQYSCVEGDHKGALCGNCNQLYSI